MAIGVEWVLGSFWIAMVAFFGAGTLVRLIWGSADPATGIHGPAELYGTRDNAVSLTFDDGPDPDSTPALLEALRAHKARATFFLLVDQAEAHPELARAIAAEHEVGLHGLVHTAWLTVTPAKRGARDLVAGRERLQELTGAVVTRFRPPFGATSPHLARAAKLAGLTLTWGRMRTRDGGAMTPEALRQRCQAIQSGDIVILHEGKRAAREALPAVLDDLASRGLHSVAVCDLGVQ